MKHLISILIIVVLFSGCRTTRKTTQSAVKTETNTTTNQSVDSEKAKKVESDLAVVKKTTTKTTKYRPKITPQKPQPVDNYSTIKQEEPERGDIESETTTVIEETLIDKSKIEEVENNKEELKTTEGVKTETVTTQKETRKAIIRPWTIALVISVVITSLIFLFRKSPLISGILAFIKKLFGGK